jgi:hypothetical protein
MALMRSALLTISGFSAGFSTDFSAGLFGVFSCGGFWA